jgi:O-antigen/teichoic acid export membrane protein
VVLIWVAVILWRNETGFAFATMSGFMAIGLMGAWYVLGEILRLPHEPGVSMRGLARSVLRYGGYVYGANLLHYVATRGLLIILSYFYAAEHVGFFSVALVLVETVLVVPSVVGQLLFPQSSKASFDYGLTDRIIRFNVYIGLLTIAVVLLLAEPIVEFVLGAAYRPVSVAFVHLTPSILFMAVPRILSYVLSGQGHPEYPLVAAALSLVIGGGVALAIVPSHGIVGAAWAANLISGITAIVTTYGYTHLRGVRVGEVFAPRRSDVGVFRSVLDRVRGSRGSD